ncbi:restriction endonuclease subunit S [Myxococcus sp. CA033]|uniref:restriction endonuclease subunit S n=1 Tax=Myxococcus sp. CA033 TaxID=2741516 RepID=UPI00157B7D86|nr:restriction endonuclease subunit S [Myxococcus sp. CA033]NTX36611.1 restriction endonuclease subunit S [Myxococcus sp. CA033]
MTLPERIQLPAGWVWVTFGDLLSEPLANGLSIKGSETPPGVPALKLNAMSERGFDWSKVRFLPIDWDEVIDLEVQEQDFFISRGNGSLALVGRGTSAQEPAKRVIFPDTMIRARICEPIRSTGWVQTVWSCPGVREQIERRVKTTAGIWKISQGEIESIRLPIPPLSEQIRIVGEVEKQVTRLDAGVEALKRVHAQLKRYRASVLKAACEGRLVPTEAELARREKRDYEPADKLLVRILKERRTRWEADQLAKMKAAGKPPKDEHWKARYVEPEPADSSKLSPLPKGWVWSTVGAVGDVLLGRQRAPQYLTGQHTRPYLRVANIKDNYIDYSDIESMDFDDNHRAKYQLLNGDILLSEGQSPELVGQSAIYRGSIADLCFQKTLHRFRATQHGPSPEFAQIVFRSNVKTGAFMRLSSITTNIAHLTLEKLVASPFPLPPKAEQDRIEAEVSARMSVAEVAEASILLSLTRAAKLRQSILQRAFDGSLVPQDPRDEPAYKLLELISAAVETKPVPKQIRARQTTAALKMKATR